MAITETTTTSPQFNLRFPKPFYRSLRLYCFEKEISMREWLEKAARSLVLKRRAWSAEQAWDPGVLADEWDVTGYPYYQCVPDLGGVHVLTINLTNIDLVEHVKEQAEADGITIREFMWTAAVDQVWTLRKERFALGDEFGIPE